VQSTRRKDPDWIKRACNHAAYYIVRFVNNPGVERIVAQFDPEYAQIQNPNERLNRLSSIAAKDWDFRRGRERYEVVANEPMDQEGAELGKIILDGAKQAEMASSSTATLKHYAILAILGGANKSPYYRLKYALEQDVTYDKLVFLACEREVLPPEQAQAAAYTLNARTEYDLGIGAIKALLGTELVDGKEYELVQPNWRISHFQKNDGTPILVLSAPPLDGRQRANTSDTYKFLLQTEEESIGLGKDILFSTAATYQYAQYFDAVRDILLQTGANIEVIGYELAYSGMEYKPSKSLQELKSAVDAAVRLRDALKKYGAEIHYTKAGLPEFLGEYSKSKYRRLQ